MHLLKVRNVHEALPNGIDLLCRSGYERDSRYGKVIKMEAPVTTFYSHPWERVVFWQERDANPFLHLFEALYLLAGRNDVEFLRQFAKRMEQFSDDGITFHGGYGKRWRSWFKIDQIQIIIDTLKKNKDDRRCVLEMWSTQHDLGKEGKDFPCNTHVYFSVNREKELDMTVCCRSNDIIWGAYGANSVCFSILQEYIATGIGIAMGRYWQISNDYHAYLDVFTPLVGLAGRANCPYRTKFSPYDLMGVEPTMIVDAPLKEWDEDLKMWFVDPFKIGLRSSFFRRIATPMYAAHKAYKTKDNKQALEIVNTQMPPKSDWTLAVKEWLERRLLKKTADASN